VTIIVFCIETFFYLTTTIFVNVRIGYVFVGDLFYAINYYFNSIEVFVMRKVLFVFVASAIVMAFATILAHGEMQLNALLAVEETEAVSEEQEQQVEAEANYKFALRLRDMNSAMRLDLDQMDVLLNIHRDFNRGISKLLRSSSVNQREMLVRLVEENCSEVRDLVDRDQYIAYLDLFNRELQRSGLSNLLHQDQILAAH